MAATDGPRVWLDRMNRALATRNYQALFMHQHGSQSETLRIDHRVRHRCGRAHRLARWIGARIHPPWHPADLLSARPAPVLVERSRRGACCWLAATNSDAVGAASTAASWIRHARQRPHRAHHRDRRRATAAAMATGCGYDERHRHAPQDRSCMTPMAIWSSRSCSPSCRCRHHIADEALEPQVDARGFRWLREDGHGHAEH